MEKISKVTVIGAGNMGGSIACGMAKGSIVPASCITVTARTRETLDRIGKSWPQMTTMQDNRTAVKDADLVIIAVKPWQAADVIKEIRDGINYGKTVVASVVAGIPFVELAAMFDKGSGEVPEMFRIIPNTAIALMKSTTFIAGNNGDGPARLMIDAIFREMGEVIWTDETMMSAGTSLASCGIAFALKYIDASIKGGVALGFSEQDARQTVINTMEGALALLKANGTMPQQEIDKVTTPGGYTFKGLQAMEEKGFPEAVMEGLKKSM